MAACPLSAASRSAARSRSLHRRRPLDAENVLATAWGGSYVNDFIQNGRVKKVFVQADAGYRMVPEDIDRWHVRNASGEMVPLSAIASGS